MSSFSHMHLHTICISSCADMSWCTGLQTCTYLRKWRYISHYARLYKWDMRIYSWAYTLAYCLLHRSSSRFLNFSLSKNLIDGKSIQTSIVAWFKNGEVCLLGSTWHEDRYVFSYKRVRSDWCTLSASSVNTTWTSTRVPYIDCFCKWIQSRAMWISVHVCTWLDGLIFFDVWYCVFLVDHDILVIDPQNEIDEDLKEA